jgi:hypothetical protein
MGVQNDPNVQAALVAVDADLTQLAADKATSVTANDNLNSAQTVALTASGAVYDDNGKLASDVQALYSAIQNATGIAPAPLAGPPPAGDVPSMRSAPRGLFGKVPTGRASATTIMTWIERVVALLGPLAVPLIEAYLAKASWLTPAERAMLDRMLESLLGKIPTGA